MPVKKPIIKLSGVTKTFSSGSGSVRALHNINLDIYEGDIFGIIGASGAGKSTLVRCINLLERPTEGEVFFKDINLSTLSPPELREARKSIGMIFQNFNLLMQRTALKNVSFPLEISGVPKKDARERALALLEMVGLSDKAKSYPSQLSGGQKQRVAIARALATNPDVILCDEATSALDPTTTRSILALLKEINEKLGKTIVIITHEMSVIEEICSKVAILDDSLIVETGMVADIFPAPKTEAARRLLYPDNKSVAGFGQSGRSIKIIFGGDKLYEPIISNMILDLKESVNIVFASTGTVDGNFYGQLIFKVANDDKTVHKVLSYLHAKGVDAEEVLDR